MTTPPSISTRFPSLAAFESATLTADAVRSALPYNLTVRSSDCDAGAIDSSTFEIICTFPTRDRRRKACDYRIAVKRIEEESVINDDDNATDEEGFVVVQSTPYHNHPQTHPAPTLPSEPSSAATTSRNPATNLVPPSEPAAEDSSSDSEEESAPRRRGRVSRTKALFEGVPTIGKKIRRKLLRPPPTAAALEEYARWEEIIGGGDTGMRLVGKYGTGQTALDLAIRKLDLALAPVKTRAVVEESEYEYEQDQHHEESLPSKIETTNNSAKSTIPRNRNTRPIHSFPTRSSNRLTTARRQEPSPAPPIIVVDYTRQLSTATIPTPSPMVAMTSANENAMEQDSSEEMISPLFSREPVDTPMTDCDEVEKSLDSSEMTVESTVTVGGSTTEPAADGLGIDSLHFPFSSIPNDSILPSPNDFIFPSPNESTSLTPSTSTKVSAPTNAISGKKGLMELCIGRKRRLSTTVRLDTKNRRCSFVEDDAGAGNEGGRDEATEVGSWFVDEDESGAGQG